MSDLGVGRTAKCEKPWLTTCDIKEETFIYILSISNMLMKNIFEAFLQMVIKINFFSTYFKVAKKKKEICLFLKNVEIYPLLKIIEKL